MNTHHSDVRGRLLAYVLALATLALYWPGLHGPFLLDDGANLGALQRWLDGQASALEVMFGNASGRLGRPVSMLSFLASAGTGGLHPFAFKLGNLLVHVACGLIGWRVLALLLAQHRATAPHARALAAFVAALWLLHPINVSTVLYAVQRMAQLGSLFALASLWAYVVGRTQLADGRTRQGLWKLFGLFPLLLLCGMFSKENAAVAPALCLLAELVFFRGRPAPGHGLRAFYAIFLAVPALFALGLLVFSPSTLLGGYVMRDFTLLERLLSQARALCEYTGLIAWPRGEAMGVFVDDFATSTGLLSPPTTALAIAGLLALSGAALALRQRAPEVCFGWFFFLVAHGVESSAMPLELYFEHRNYLPAWGLLLAAGGLLFRLGRWIADNWAPRAWVLRGAATLAVAAVALVAVQQVQVWRSMEGIVAQALAYRPTSLRANLETATLSIRAGDLESARRVMDRLATSGVDRHEVIGRLNRVALDCLLGRPLDGSDLAAVRAIDLRSVTAIEVQAFRPLSTAVVQDQCGGQVDDATVAEGIVELLSSTGAQSESSRPKGILRMAAANHFLRANRLTEARQQSELAWQSSSAGHAAGLLIAAIQVREGNKQGAQQTLDRVRASVGSHEVAASRQLGEVQSAIDAL